ncbi:MAG: hypothetical protein L7H00_05805 [Vulcanisaeta sp.]|nr:hypothetical protein [Vulcanisaeta sp.]
MPKRKRINNKGFTKRYREVIVECAKLARQFPRGERLRAYRECLKEKLKALQ